MCHIDEVFDFLGIYIQRQRQRGSGKLIVYAFPAKKALASVKAKVKAASRTGTNQTLADLIGRLNPILRGWTYYFHHGSSKATFAYLRHYTWSRVVHWLAASTVGRVGRICDGSTSPQRGGPSRTAWCCSIHRRWRSPAIVRGATTSPRRGPRGSAPPLDPSDLWRAGCGESRTSGSGSGPGKPTGQ